MRSVALGETGLSCSVLGFGCSALLGRSGRRESLRALGAAWDAGITFYDTARAYGYGESEALLGQFLRGRRDRALVATKFGILAAPQPLWKRAAKPVVRGLLAVAPGARAVVRKQVSREFTANEFTVPVLERSLEESLRKLRMDYVDLLFMHSAPESVLHDGELLGALEKVVRAGKARIAGISCEPHVAAVALGLASSPLSAVQFPCNVFDLSVSSHIAVSANRRWAAIANHPFGGVARVQQCRDMLKKLADSPDTPPDLRGKLGGVDDAVLADVVLNVILRDTGIHVVVPAMMKLNHLQENVRAVTASRFDGEQIAWLRANLLARGDIARVGSKCQ